MKPDEQRMRDVLVDTIRLLCRTGVEYSRRLRVQGLLGITVDDEHVFLIHVDDFIVRNGADDDDRFCGFADKCNSPAVGHTASNVAVSRANNANHIVADAVYQHQLAACAKCPNHLSLDEQTHNDILTSVALSEISSVVGASAVVQDLPSFQLSSHNACSVPHRENSLSTPNSQVSSESPNQLNISGNTAAAAAASETGISQLLPNEVDSENKDGAHVVLKMETGKENITNIVCLPAPIESESGMTVVNLANQNQHRLSNLDDTDSSGADTNDDGDSEHTSESEEVADHASVAQLLSSLRYDPRALVGNVSRWQIGTLQQHSLSDSGADAVALQPAVLTGVVQTGGSNVSAYYQQQVAFCVFTTIHALIGLYQIHNF